MRTRVWPAIALAALAFALVPSAAPASAGRPRLTEREAVRIFLAEDKVADWTGRYPKESLVTDADYEPAFRDWTVKVWSGPAGEIALGRVDDLSADVEEAWTGPQVAWTMARGGDGAFGGRRINSLPIWLGFCAVFLVGLADLRRPLSLRNLDLVVLLSLSVSLWFFNEGRIFTSVPLVYPVLLYLLARSAWIGHRDRSPRAGVPVWPVWLLAAATVFLAGFRIGLHRSGNVIDVGYASVIGAQRIAAGQAPYGHFPQERGKPCAPADRNGRQVYRIQTNGRCEAAAEHGDTYGPVVYEAYLPGYAVKGWKGKGDTLGAARFTSVLLDLACILGLGLVGLRYGGWRLGVTLAFAWTAYPFTQYVSSANSNDALPPALLIAGFWLASSHWARGALAGLASWTKFAPFVVGPLWATYPDARRPRTAAVFAAAFVVATLVAFWVLLLEPDPLEAVGRFWHRTLGNQLGRDSPFSIWDWRQYHAGLPDLHVLQWVLESLLVVAALGLAALPRQKSPLQLAAFTAALLIGFELVLTHWFYLYVPWFFPFVAIAVLAPEGRKALEEGYSSPSAGCEASLNSRSSPVTR